MRRVNTDLDRQLDEAQEELVRKEKLAILGQLAGSVAHEIRNPLGAIGNSVYYLTHAEQDLAEDSRDSLRDIEREVAAANRIVGELLDYARPPELEPVETSCASLVDEAIRMLEVPETVVLERNVSHAGTVAVDAGQLTRVLRNLMLNAIQAMNGNGTLRLSLIHI